MRLKVANLRYVTFSDDFYRQVRNWNEEILSTSVNSDSNDDW